MNLGAAGTVINARLIAGFEAGVSLGTGSAVFNTGIISGAFDAIALVAGTITNAVSGANATLELGSGAETASIAGIGTQFRDFGTIAIEAGSQWFLEGSARGLSTVAISGFVTGDTIEIDGFTAGSEGYVGNALTLTGTGTVATETLDFVSANAPNRVLRHRCARGHRHHALLRGWHPHHDASRSGRGGAPACGR